MIYDLFLLYRFRTYTGNNKIIMFLMQPTIPKTETPVHIQPLQTAFIIIAFQEFILIFTLL